MTYELIQSRQNKQIKHLIKLNESSAYRTQQEEAILEGIHLLSSVPHELIKKVFIPLSHKENNEILSLISLLDKKQIIFVDDALARNISHLHQGTEVFTLISIKFHQPLFPLNKDCVILDRIQDPGNLGTILRSAAATGVKNIILSKGCVDPFSPKVLRAAMGAHFFLDIFKNISLSDYLIKFQGPVYLTSLKSKNSIYDEDLSAFNAWIFGNEGQGVDSSLIHSGCRSVIIPMLGQTESINVSMAASVCLFEQMRQRISYKLN